MNDLTNMTTLFMQQLNNPDCSMVSGMIMGNMFTLKYILIILGIGITYGFINKLVSDSYNFIKNKVKEARG